jgi:hypothetical protein
MVFPSIFKSLPASHNDLTPKKTRTFPDPGIPNGIGLLHHAEEGALGLLATFPGTKIGQKPGIWLAK